jgi:hypothetical protein
MGLTENNDLHWAKTVSSRSPGVRELVTTGLLLILYKLREAVPLSRARVVSMNCFRRPLICSLGEGYSDA